MNLTEPQAGSDVGALRATATPRGDGRTKSAVRKSIISFGDHDMVGQHRPPGARPHTRCAGGNKGISLFLVPKYQVAADGSLGERATT